jgi:iron complex outermembrane receptor protein
MNMVELIIAENNQMYYNAPLMFTKVNSFANYRTPYWRPVAACALSALFGDGTPASYQGYVPTFEGDLNDYNATIGYKSTKKMVGIQM